MWIGIKSRAVNLRPGDLPLTWRKGDGEDVEGRTFLARRSPKGHMLEFREFPGLSRHAGVLG